MYSFTSDQGIDGDIAEAPFLGDLLGGDWLEAIRAVRAGEIDVNVPEVASAFFSQSLNITVQMNTQFQV